MNVGAMSYNFGGGMDASLMVERKGAALIDKIDTDADGALNKTELNISDELFSQIDGDGDGLIQSSELKTGLDQLRDSVKNGTVSEDDFKDLAEKLGLPDPSQMQGAMQGPPPPPPGGMDTEADLIGQLDTDADGSLSNEELAISEELFAKIDEDGDTLISGSELKNSLDPLKKTGETSTAASEENSATAITEDDFKELAEKLGLPYPEDRPPEKMNGMQNPADSGNDSSFSTNMGAYSQSDISTLISQMFSDNAMSGSAFNYGGFFMDYVA